MVLGTRLVLGGLSRSVHVFSWQLGWQQFTSTHAAKVGLCWVTCGKDNLNFFHVENYPTCLYMLFQTCRTKCDNIPIKMQGVHLENNTWACTFLKQMLWLLKCIVQKTFEKIRKISARILSSSIFNVFLALILSPLRHCDQWPHGRWCCLQRRMMHSEDNCCEKSPSQVEGFAAKGSPVVSPCGWRPNFFWFDSVSFELMY